MSAVKPWTVDDVAGWRRVITTGEADPDGRFCVFDDDKRWLASLDVERAKVDALVRALLTLEWRYHHPHSDSCTYCGAVRYTLPRITNDKRHASDCAVDAALTLAGYPDQASRDAKRAAK